MIRVLVFFDCCIGEKPWGLRITITLHCYMFSKKVEDFLQEKASSVAVSCLQIYFIIEIKKTDTSIRGLQLDFIFLNWLEKQRKYNN